MAFIEGFRIQNFRALKDITLGILSGGNKQQDALTPLTVVIGQNGVGKSTLFDAFSFIADCLSSDVENACDRPQRGGFDRLKTLGSNGPIRFEIYYRETNNEKPITYELAINLDKQGRPFVTEELLKQQRTGAKSGKPYPFLRLTDGKGSVWAGNTSLEGEDKEKQPVALTNPRVLGIATLGNLTAHPRIERFRNFLQSWFLSYFTPDAARSLPSAGPQKHLNKHGDNIGNVVQYLEREHKERFKKILEKIALKIPGISKIDTHITEDKRLLLRFNDGTLKDPFFAQQMSDGTLKVFAYLLLLEDPEPPPFICIEEPENGLYHQLLETLAEEFRSHATGKKNSSQIFVTTHQPYFVDALTPEEVWILEKNNEGFSTIRRASDSPLVNNMVQEGLQLGGLWYSDYLEVK